MLIDSKAPLIERSRISLGVHTPLIELRGMLIDSKAPLIECRRISLGVHTPLIELRGMLIDSKTPLIERSRDERNFPNSSHSFITQIPPQKPQCRLLP
jgi:hypothetical protein